MVESKSRFIFRITSYCQTQCWRKCSTQQETDAITDRFEAATLLSFCHNSCRLLTWHILHALPDIKSKWWYYKSAYNDPPSQRQPYYSFTRTCTVVHWKPRQDKSICKKKVIPSRSDINAMTESWYLFYVSNVQCTTNVARRCVCVCVYVARRCVCVLQKPMTLQQIG